MSLLKFGLSNSYCTYLQCRGYYNTEGVLILSPESLTYRYLALVHVQGFIIGDESARFG